jgi:DNA-binding NtrC family response regulator
VCGSLINTGESMTSSSTAVAQVEALEPHISHILVVEDEVLIRMVISDALRDEGFAVIEAFNADEAADILRAGKVVDLVFSDVRMPGSLDGVGLLAFVQEYFPQLPVILNSAHLEPSVAMAGGAKRFLRTPYKVRTVVHLIAEELAKSI